MGGLNIHGHRPEDSLCLIIERGRRHGHRPLNGLGCGEGIGAGGGAGGGGEICEVAVSRHEVMQQLQLS